VCNVWVLARTIKFKESYEFCRLGSFEEMRLAFPGPRKGKKKKKKKEGGIHMILQLDGCHATDISKYG
jgi:hypothetical protein